MRLARELLYGSLRWLPQDSLIEEMETHPNQAQWATSQRASEAAGEHGWPHVFRRVPACSGV